MMKPDNPIDDQKKLQGRKVGVVGLGVMGKPMARNLHSAGAEVVVASRGQAPVRELVAEGMAAPADLPELARAVGAEGVVILMLPFPEAVEAVVRGERGLLESLEPGSLVIDMSSTSVALTRELGEELGGRGCDFIDAPVSGGEVGAVDASMTIFAGGSEEAFARALPFFEVLGGKARHMGGTGAGQVTKLANQVIVALSIDAVAEALVLVEGAGVEPGKVREALGGGFADSRILDLIGQRMVERSFEPGGRTAYQLKDLRHACQLMGECGLELPTLRASVPLWQKMIDEGKSELDHSALFTLFDPQLANAQRVVDD
ncbi:MAG: NAD(P)-dependent oxidoreductase [Verrucomicrobiales bacterium]